METRYFDMIYQPVQHLPGITDSIYIVAVDITDHILAKTKLQESTSTLQLAVTAARIGTWSFDLKTKKLSHNRTYAEILGWHKKELMTNEQILSHVVEKFRAPLSKIAAIAIADGTDYEYIYAFRRFDNNQIIWLKVIGMISATGLRNQGVFSGIVTEVSGEEPGFEHSQPARIPISQ